MRSMRVGDGALILIGVAAAAAAFIIKDHLATPYDPLFDAAGAKYQVPPNLLRAIGRHESAFNPLAMDPKTSDYPNGTRDVGVMQINSSTGNVYGLTRTDLLDPAKNIGAAARLLAESRKTLGLKFSPWTWAASYNVGPDLLPADRGSAYAAAVVYHWQLYDLGRVLA